MDSCISRRVGRIRVQPNYILPLGPRHTPHAARRSPLASHLSFSLLALDHATSFPLSLDLTPSSSLEGARCNRPSRQDTTTRYTYTLSTLNSFACLSIARDCIELASAESRLAQPATLYIHLQPPNGQAFFFLISRIEIDLSFPSSSYLRGPIFAG